MAPKTSILIVSAASVALGIALLVTSSLVVDDVRPALKTCDAFNSLLPWIKMSFCTYVDYWLAIGSFGIIASLIQIASFGAAWLGKIKVWCGIHIVICVLSIASFGMAVSHYGFNDSQVEKLVALTVFCMIDMVFAPAAAGGVYYLNR